MQALTGRPSAMTRHCEHWPLAQKRPWGLPSLWWWPNTCTPAATRAEESISFSKPVRAAPFQVNAAGRRSGTVRTGWVSILPGVMVAS